MNNQGKCYQPNSYLICNLICDIKKKDIFLIQNILVVFICLCLK